MAYNYSKGNRKFGDITAEGDAEGNTKIDFEEDYIALETSGSAVLVVSGSKVGIGTTTPDYELDVAGDIGVNQYIRHNDDTNTHINFTDDKIVLKAGGKAMITMEEKGSAPHEITLNDGGNNIDLVVKGNGSNAGNPGMFFDASNNRVGINGVGSPSWELDVDGDIGLSEYIYHKGDDDTYIRFQDNDVRIATAGSTRLKVSSGAVTINEAYTLPTNDGSDKQVLSTNGAGVVTWETTSGGGGGGGEIDIIKLALAEDTNFTWNGSSGDYHQVPFTRTLVDTFSSNPYSTGTNYFTAPSDGVYEFHVRLTLNNIQSGATQYQGWLMTTSGSGVFSQNGYHAAAITQFDPPTSQSILKLDMFTVVDLSANHSASVFIRQIGGNQNNCHLMHWPMQTSIIIKKLL